MPEAESRNTGSQSLEYTCFHMHMECNYIIALHCFEQQLVSKHHMWIVIT